MNQWDYALIFKELNETEEELECDNKLQYKKKWGSQLLSKNIKGKLTPTYFIQFMNEYP